MKFLIINAYSWVNKGDFGIRIGMIKALKAAFGKQTQIKIVSSTPIIDKKKYEKYGATVTDWGILKNFTDPPIVKFIYFLWTTSLLIYWAIIYRITKYVKNDSLTGEYAEADIIISPGGGFLNDNFLLSTLVPNLFQIYLAILMRKPYVVYAQSIGPFNSRLWAFFTKIILNKAKLITVREKISKEWLIRIGVTKPSIYVTSDAAFILESIRKENVDKIFNQEGIPHESIIGITPVDWSFPNSKNKQIKYWNYVNALAGTIDYLTSYKKLNILVIPQVTDIRSIGEKGDKITLEDILQKIQNKKNIFILKGDYSPEELIGIYGQMKLFIGSRMHSNIFALIAGVPCVAIAYEHKTDGIMREWELEKWVIPINDIDSHILIEKTENLLCEEKNIRMQIKNIHGIIKEKSLLNALLIKNMLIQEDK